MGQGYFLVRGDKTTCGGKIIEGADDHTIMGIPQAREMDRVTCGRYPGMFIIVGGVPQTDIHGRLMAGSLDSQSSCPCKARFIASMMNDTYETGGSNSGDGSNEPEQHAQSAQKNLTSDSESSSDDVKLDYSIKLSGNRILTPLSIPDYKEMINGGSTQNTEKIDFLITNKGDEAEGFSLEVRDGEELVYSERQTSKFFEKGEHTWQWDGYSDQGILDTRQLKSKSLQVRLVALCGDKMIRIDYHLDNSSKEQEWVDVRVDRDKKLVDITWRLAVEDGGTKGSNPKLSPIPYSDLVSLTKNGVEFYWSRNGSRGGGIGDGIVTAQGSFKVNVKADMNIEPFMRPFDLISSLDSDFQASVSLRWNEKIYHNYGDSYKETGDELLALLDANNRYKWDSAHEMGHKVLDEYGAGSSPDYSWTHKGTSTLSQERIPGSVMPAQGEIDVMKYGLYRADMYTRLVAATEDVQGLIWLSRVKFND
ncbi:PAAR domain-containing protein [Salmonella enterica]|nr:PAAR domain-containing protein [Salmonella enterica]EBQ2672197.1 PAAR domain-containing protein [Salmonella enterica]EHM6376771.1 PAAR domain-containing protein [Salmonella enterica]EHN6183647.1 PAAR domain-containing protein [Salmonella enterica]EKI5630171.1 PAAR domain-containing protein [Salmonella enterica]